MRKELFNAIKAKLASDVPERQFVPSYFVGLSEYW